MTSPSNDPSIENEPHLKAGPFQGDPTEPAGPPCPAADTDDDRVEQSVWDEPALADGPRPPPGALTYRNWLLARRNKTSAGRSWAVTLLVAAAAGPWAILGALLGGRPTAFGLVMVVLFAPVVEETMKVAAAFYVVEKRPFLFRSAWQIALCALAGGLVFAAIENLLYLHIYVPDPQPWLVRWRWTVCVALHSGCSTIAGLGLVRVWRGAWRRLDRPMPQQAFPLWLIAVILHGTYNGLAVLFELVVP
jgi:hypothetical protein